MGYVENNGGPGYDLSGLWVPNTNNSGFNSFYDSSFAPQAPIFSGGSAIYNQPCRYWKRVNMGHNNVLTAGCQYGASCHFLHAETKSEEFEVYKQLVDNP